MHSITKNDPLLDWAPDGLSLELIRAARLALERQRSIAPACKSDGTLVTPADTDIESMLEDFFRENMPESRVIGEETLSLKGQDYLSAALRGKSWIIDPVDGTVLYAMGMPGWGISLGYIENGRCQQGVVVYPTRTVGGDHLQFLFGTQNGSVLLSETLWPHENEQSNTEQAVLSRLIVNAAPIRQLPVVKGYDGLMAISQRIARQALYRGNHPVVSLGASVATFRHLMDGGIVAYFVKLKLWDIAAVLPLAWRLGLRACLSDGSPIDLEISARMWICDPSQPDFVSLTDHVLFYRSDRVGTDILDDFSWPNRT